jgi:hypothetical protein
MMDKPQLFNAQNRLCYNSPFVTIELYQRGFMFRAIQKAWHSHNLENPLELQRAPAIKFYLVGFSIIVVLWTLLMLTVPMPPIGRVVSITAPIIVILGNIVAFVLLQRGRFQPAVLSRECNVFCCWLFCACINCYLSARKSFWPYTPPFA